MIWKEDTMAWLSVLFWHLFWGAEQKAEQLVSKPSFESWEYEAQVPTTQQ